MRNWNLKAGDPLSLTLAADARLTQPSYCNDQIWELTLGGGEPSALALQTTYGLRARGMRLFPRFTEGITSLTDPAQFAAPPVVRQFFPNFIKVTGTPFPEIEVTAEYWLPDSQAVAGRLVIANRGQEARQLRLDWVAALLPIEGAQGMAPATFEFAPALAGQIEEFAPVVFITGGAIPTLSPFPALVHEIELEPGAACQYTWCHAALDTPEASFAAARQFAASRWEAEKARVELLNASQVEILTGDPDWDAALALSQKVALGLFSGPTEHLPYPSPLNARRPDDGFSPCSGGDYGPLWSGQTALEAYFLSGLLLPAAPGLARGLLLNFFAAQGEDGSLDWKPGLGGQRGGRLATPLLASLAWRIYLATEDRALLETVFPQLLAFQDMWFDPHHDRDEDGVPEWDHPLQTGLDDHPLFARWHPWAQGVEASVVESPALCAMLARECQSLIKIARLIGQEQALEELQARIARLSAAVEAAWDDQAACYRYWDRDAHNSPPLVVLGERQGPGVLEINREFDQPLRPVLRVLSGGESTRRVQVFLHGAGPAGNHRVERIPSERFSWFPALGTATSERVYAGLEYAEIQGVGEDDLVSLCSAGLDSQDISNLLPLWAGLPTKEQAHKLIRRSITAAKRYRRPYGLPTCPGTPADPDAQACQAVHIPWCSLIGEGLLAYDKRQAAADLVGRLMRAVIQSLKSSGSFRRGYHAETGQGSGERDALAGLAPLGLFLDTLGVRLISERRVALSGFNPFPWPVTVRYRQLTVLRQSDRTQVIFPDGQAVSVTDPEPRIVSLE